MCKRFTGLGLNLRGNNTGEKLWIGLRLRNNASHWVYTYSIYNYVSEYIIYSI